MTQPSRQVRARTKTYGAIERIARNRRLSMVTTLDLLVDAWSSLSADQQNEIVRRPAKSRKLISLTSG